MSELVVTNWSLENREKISSKCNLMMKVLLFLFSFCEPLPQMAFCSELCGECNCCGPWEAPLKRRRTSLTLTGKFFFTNFIFLRMQNVYHKKWTNIKPAKSLKSNKQKNNFHSLFSYLLSGWDFRREAENQWPFYVVTYVHGLPLLLCKARPMETI